MCFLAKNIDINTISLIDSTDSTSQSNSSSILQSNITQWMSDQQLYREQFDEWNTHCKNVEMFMLDKSYFQFNQIEDVLFQHYSSPQFESTNWNVANQDVLIYIENFKLKQFVASQHLNKRITTHILSLILLKNNFWTNKFNSQITQYFCWHYFKENGNLSLSSSLQLTNLFYISTEINFTKKQKITPADTNINTIQNIINVDINDKTKMHLNWFLNSICQSTNSTAQWNSSNRFKLLQNLQLKSNRLFSSQESPHNSYEKQQNQKFESDFLSVCLNYNFELNTISLNNLSDNQITETTTDVKVNSTTEFLKKLCSKIESQIANTLFPLTKKYFSYELILSELTDSSLVSSPFQHFPVYEQLATYQFNQFNTLKKNNYLKSSSQIINWSEHIANLANQIQNSCVMLLSRFIKQNNTDLNETNKFSNEITENYQNDQINYWSIIFLLDSLLSLTSIESNQSKIHLKKTPSAFLNTQTTAYFNQHLNFSNVIANNIDTSFLLAQWNRHLLKKFPQIFSYSNLRYWTHLVFNSYWFEQLLLTNLNTKILNSTWNLNSNTGDSNLIAKMSLRNVLIRSKIISHKQKHSLVHLAPAFTTRLIRFAENISNRRVFLQIEPNLYNFISPFEMSQISLWTRNFRFYKKLFPSIYVDEMLQVFWLALKLRDSEFLSEWIRRSMLKISSWDHRLFMAYVRNVLRLLVINQHTSVLIRGVKLVLRGKISVAGNARTRTIFIRLGFTSNSTIINRVYYSFRTVGTFTGVLGLHVSLIY